MKKLIIKKIDPALVTPQQPFLPYNSQNETHTLGNEPWTNAKSSTHITFQIAHDTSNLFLNFTVKEEFTLALNTLDGGPVYQDSCVEFFFCGKDDTYFNFEFNALGTCLVEKGSSRDNRAKLDPTFLKTILRQPSLVNTPLSSPTKIEEWNLSLKLPLASLLGHTLSGFKARGNFYKCGDNLPSPHYFAWSDIQTAKPDFHRPEFFGELLFE